ncbi:ribonuclease H-like domain-containing protein [Tanacetum coccineum]
MNQATVQDDKVVFRMFRVDRTGSGETMQEEQGAAGNWGISRTKLDMQILMLKGGSTAQTMFMANLSSADPVYDDSQLGSEDTLEIDEITRKNMNDKMKTPLWTKQNINIRPPYYSKENYLTTFKPQTQLTPEQIFWSKDVLKMEVEALKEQTTASRPIKALMVAAQEESTARVKLVLPVENEENILSSYYCLYTVNACPSVMALAMIGVTKQKKVQPILLSWLILQQVQTLLQTLRQIMDKCKTGLGYNVVPPPYTGNFMPPKSDLVYPSLDDFVDVNESVSKFVVEKPAVETNEPETARKENGAPIIEDSVSDSNEENVPKVKTVEMFNKHSFAKINFVKSTEQVKSSRKTSVDKNRQNTPRCDNGTEFKNKFMNQFCEMKGIKREFSVARTPQQNGVAKKKNRTLIEAARTMLADSKLPTTFWAEAVNTACRKPALSFMRPFGCPITILNTLDHLGTKACNDEDSKSSPDAGFKRSREKEKKDAEDPRNESGNPTEGKDSEVPSIEEPRINQEKDDNINSTNNINTASDGNNTNNVNVVSSTVNAAGIKVNAVNPKTSIELLNDPNIPELENIFYSDDDEDVGAEADMNNLDAFMPISPIPTTRIHKDHPIEQIIGDLH